MVRFKNIIIGAIIVAIGVWVAIYFFPSEEKKIKKQFCVLAE
jgi:putative Mn2+ efflux pump MntP